MGETEEMYRENEKVGETEGKKCTKRMREWERKRGRNVQRK